MNQEPKPNMANNVEEMELLVKAALGKLTILRVEYFTTHPLGDVFEKDRVGV